ncbi:MAG: phytanoyl-CoA dioxygenase family protein [Candidatus Koribacter versatilis]|uniref:Phytanoyl-CoA dioxygenase family protein n=1 Tax=Candidatus Korobacter versatilis TaxID=658062 RepID=A0A932ENU0_9BACT|nr:phytanoyl-CoA dioxygenase family protein [Candidatus Koribacter versatilis]
MSLDEKELVGVAAELMRRRAIVALPADLRERALSADYWRKLVPGLSVEGAAGAEMAGPAMTDETVAAAAGAVANHGYFHVEEALAPQATAAMRQAVEALVAAGWPAGFSFVYDEFWRATRTAPMLRFLRRVLGEDCVQLEGIWTHYVRPTRGSHGWPPHVDSGGYRERPEAIGVWFALSDATLDNGCMYVVPQDLVPENIVRGFLDLKSFTLPETKQLLQAARALPARAGAMMGWDFNVIHWGSTCHGGATPRISTAMEFSSRAQAALKPDQTVVALSGPLPSLDHRLKLISRSLLSYTRFEPLLAPFGPLAQALLGGNGPR